jgi:hypothetical protein
VIMVFWRAMQKVLCLTPPREAAAGGAVACAPPYTPIAFSYYWQGVRRRVRE